MLFGALDISSSGLVAQRQRLTAIAGNIANIETLALLLDPLIFGSIYSATVRWCPPFALLVIDALALANLVLTCFMRLPPASKSAARTQEIAMEPIY